MELACGVAVAADGSGVLVSLARACERGGSGGPESLTATMHDGHQPGHEDHREQPGERETVDHRDTTGRIRPSA